MNISQWISEQRGRSAALAQHLRISQPVVSDWRTGKKAVPAERCKSIERFTEGVVTCPEMRPDDWHKYWPELAPAQSHPAQPAIETVAQALAGKVGG